MAVLEIRVVKGSQVSQPYLQSLLSYRGSLSLGRNYRPPFSSNTVTGNILLGDMAETPGL